MQTNSPKMNLLPTGHEDLEDWAFQRARMHEVTLSPEEVIDAVTEGVDIRSVWHNTNRDVRAWCSHNTGFARFNGRWFVPLTRTAVSSGLDPATHPGEFVALDDAECMALERVVSHWRAQAEDGR